ncbi:sugar phosphate isomerase/epimerase family protein [Rhodopirellula sallentina]|uniref:Xylose isomerase domain protein TIM barrel n=1 Tax=Rhodopirellula sallentina SM41 TaxID=1263870 RepID=M5U2K5_9BACT|nr:sugar phosphate isomerase/epimerase family protein [Rhodopirellula sallentina]EMI52091.1 Xylose isomerase domain protein TIM barrel [Rhodopirellula sallentina SM41]
MNSAPNVILSGFADESAMTKKANEQFAALAAIGLQYYSIRFVDVGNGIKNVMVLDDEEIKTLQQMHTDYGMKVSSIGSPIGKVKLLDVEDGTANKFIPFDTYLREDVQTACDRAEAFDCKLLRGFSFYHPKGTQPEDHIDQVVDQLSAIAEACDARGLTFGLEVEANLVGQTGHLLADIAAKVNHPAMVTIFDGANIVMQGFTPDQVYAQYQAMKPSLGWLHIKDYSDPTLGGRVDHVDEESASHFVPADRGDSAHEAILRDLKGFLPTLHERMSARGVDGIFVDLEPHVRGGGQFGGFSGPDGFGIAARALCKLLDYVGIGYDLRTFESLQASK